MLIKVIKEIKKIKSMKRLFFYKDVAHVKGPRRQRRENKSLTWAYQPKLQFPLLHRSNQAEITHPSNTIIINFKIYTKKKKLLKIQVLLEMILVAFHSNNWRSDNIGYNTNIKKNTKKWYDIKNNINTIRIYE